MKTGLQKRVIHNGQNKYFEYSHISIKNTTERLELSYKCSQSFFKTTNIKKKKEKFLNIQLINFGKKQSEENWAKKSDKKKKNEKCKSKWENYNEVKNNSNR